MEASCFSFFILQSMIGTFNPDLFAHAQLVDSDRLRNSNREALTALRKIAKTSQSSVPELGNNLESSLKDRNGKECRTCGNYDQSEPVWFLCSGSDFFLNMPFHQAHLKLETGTLL